MFDIQKFAGGSTENEITINGPQWVRFILGLADPAHAVGFVPSGSSTLGANNVQVYHVEGEPYDSVYSIVIENVDFESNSGAADTEVNNATAVTVNLTEGSAISDVTVTGSFEGLTVTIGDVAYQVDEQGKLYNLPAFGLMSRADKQKLDKMPNDFSNFITGGSLTAEGFVLTNSAGEGVVTIPAQQ